MRAGNVQESQGSRRSPVAALAVLLCCLSLCGMALVSCGGGGTVVTPTVAVGVTPSTATVQTGGTTSFTATVSGSANTAVTWSVTESGGGTITASGVYTAPATAGTYHVVATSVADPTQSATATVTVTTPGGGGGDLTNIFFLHHSTGDGLIVEGDMRSVIAELNLANSTSFEFWDHGYNDDGLRNASGSFTGTNYSVPGDNTDPEGLYDLWTSSAANWTACRNQILTNHGIIAFKSCFPASEIPDAASLQWYRENYLAMRDFFDTQTDHVFVVMSTPPLHRLSTDATSAANARAFANWLSSSTYLSGHSNVVCFDLFDHLAQADDASATANMLRSGYEMSHADGDSHPNTTANAAVGPAFAQFLYNTAASL